MNVPAPKSPPTPPHPTTANVPDTEGTPALQNLTTRSSSTTKALLVPQNPTSPVLAMDAPPPSQKPVTASDSATTANTSPLSKALSTEPRLAVQTLLLTDSPATQATPEPQSLTTAKASHAQSLPETQTFSTAHAPVTEGPQTAQRLTSAHIAATQNRTVFTPPSTSKGSRLLPAGELTLLGPRVHVGLCVMGEMSTGPGLCGSILWDCSQGCLHSNVGDFLQRQSWIAVGQIFYKGNSFAIIEKRVAP